MSISEQLIVILCEKACTMISIMLMQLKMSCTDSEGTDRQQKCSWQMAVVQSLSLSVAHVHESPLSRPSLRRSAFTLLTKLHAYIVVDHSESKLAAPVSCGEFLHIPQPCAQDSSVKHHTGTHDTPPQPVQRLHLPTLNGTAATQAWSRCYSSTCPPAPQSYTLDLEPRRCKSTWQTQGGAGS